MTSYLVQRERADARIDANLAQEVDEFREIASTGLDPETGAGFTSVDRFLEVVIRRNVPDTNEGLLATVDDRARWVPGGDVDIDLRAAPGFVDRVLQTPPDAPIRAQTADTEIGSLRYVVVPVAVPGDSAQGKYVIAYSRDLEHSDLAEAYRTYAIVAALAVPLIAGVGWVVTRRLLRPLRELQETAHRISDTDLSGRIAVTGRDEISELGHTVNDMLDRIEAAVSNQRDALDDAGHDLRTPITILRGHLEILNTEDPHEVREVRALALDELDRMQRMVDDLVLLAKAKRPDFLRPQPVEVDRLVDDVLDKSRAMGERDWRVDARAEGVAMMDEQRVTQALLQLVSNALKFTEPSDTIAVGSAVRDEEVQLWVRDTGAGILESELERIFERFSRLDSGRGEEGSGLGLAIVSAIASAHRGNVGVRSTPGRGSVFTLTLPFGRS